MALFQVFVAFLSVSACLGSLLPPDVCAGISKVEIYYKDYFDIYLGNSMFMPVLSEEGRYVQVLRQVIPACCEGVPVEFVFVPDEPAGMKKKDIEAHAFEYLLNNRDGGGSVYRFYSPEFADKKERTVYDSQTEFVRLGSSPGHAIIMMTPSPIPPVFVGEIFYKSWAIMIFLIMFAGVIGMLTWMADHHTNPDQFLNPFYVGMLEGFWWSVVTMTTVGYGDKAPKGYLGRLLAIIWILISTVFLSLFTANATSILAISQAEEDYTITLGKKIGVVHSKHYVEFGLNLGAQIVEFSSVMDLITALSLGQVNRVVVPSYLDFMLLTSQPSYASMAEQFTLTNVLSHPFQLGMVLARDSNNLTNTDLKLLSCLRATTSGFEKQERDSQDLTKLKWKDQTKEEKTALDNDNLVTLTYYFFAMAAALYLIGLCWDGYAYYKNTHPRHQAADVEMAENEVTAVHEIPSGDSSPKIDNWGNDPATKYKMSLTEKPETIDDVEENAASRESLPTE